MFKQIPWRIWSVYAVDQPLEFVLFSGSLPYQDATWSLTVSITPLSSFTAHAPHTLEICTSHHTTVAIILNTVHAVIVSCEDSTVLIWFVYSWAIHLSIIIAHSYHNIRTCFSLVRPREAWKGLGQICCRLFVSVSTIAAASFIFKQKTRFFFGWCLTDFIYWAHSGDMAVFAYLDNCGYIFLTENTHNDTDVTLYVKRYSYTSNLLCS